MNAPDRPLALVTGASSGIGRQLAIQCAQHGFNLVIAADTPLQEVTAELRSYGESVEQLETDLGTPDGVDKLYAALDGRVVDALLANASHGPGRAFLQQDFGQLRHVIDSNITGTLYLIQKVARDMVAEGTGRILITGSTAGSMPGSFQAVYNGTKAFIDAFSFALRNELQDTGVTVTRLDTRGAVQEDKLDPAEVARIGFDAMIEGEADVTTGFRNRVQAADQPRLPIGG
jgi:short-subunit dehydrogenase